MSQRGINKNIATSVGLFAFSGSQCTATHMFALMVQPPEHKYLRPTGALKNNAAFGAAFIGCILFGAEHPHPIRPIWIVEWETEKRGSEKGSVG